MARTRTPLAPRMLSKAEDYWALLGTRCIDLVKTFALKNSRRLLPLAWSHTPGSTERAFYPTGILQSPGPVGRRPSVARDQPGLALEDAPCQGLEFPEDRTRHALGVRV